MVASNPVSILIPHQIEIHYLLHGFTLPPGLLVLQLSIHANDTCSTIEHPWKLAMCFLLFALLLLS